MVLPQSKFTDLSMNYNSKISFNQINQNLLNRGTSLNLVKPDDDTQLELTGLFSCTKRHVQEYRFLLHSFQNSV